MSVRSLLQRDVLEVMRQEDGTRGGPLRAPLELLRLLGSGAHGTVHLARRRGEHGFERLVAVKVLTEAEGVSAELQRRFFHEARLLGMLRHRSIVAADDLVTINGSPALVMEYVDGQDLSAVAKANRRAPGLVPLAWLAHVGMEVTTALQAAWESLNPLTGQPLRALHCDVKPSNIRITPAGSVKLLDFGVAQSRSSETAAGSVAGTRAYLSPERWVGGPATPSSDLFSLGMSLLVTAVRCDHHSRPTGASESQVWVDRVLEDLAAPYGPLRPVLRLLLDSDASQRLDQGELLERLHALAREDERRPPLLHAKVLAALDPVPLEACVSLEVEPSDATETLSAPVTTPLALMGGPDATTTSWSALDVGALATFSGLFTLESAAEVLGSDPGQAAGALRRLLSGGEVSRQEADGVPLLCASHPAAAQRTLEGLAPETQAALRLRHAAHFAAVASDRWLQEVLGGLGPPAAVQQAIEADLAVAAASGAPVEVAGVSQLALAVLAKDLPLPERVARLEALGAAPGRPERFFARTLRWRSHFAINLSQDVGISRQLLRSEIEKADARWDHALGAALWHHLAVLSQHQLDHYAARAAFHETLRLAQLADDTLMRAAASNNLGNTLMLMGDLDGAREAFAQACAAAELRSLDPPLSMAMNHLALCWFGLGRMVKAMRTATRGLRVAQRRPLPLLVAFSHLTRGALSSFAGEWEEVLEDLDPAVAGLDAAGHAFAPTALALRTRARAHLGQTEHLDADFARAQAAAQGGHRLAWLSVQLSHALALCEQGRAEEGLPIWQAARARVDTLGMVGPTLLAQAAETEAAFAAAGLGGEAGLP